ncbi:MAG: type II toxin-antitoxin system VapC family toxin [Luteolibacter sp.]
MMRTAADTSFLFSLYGKDGWTEKARSLTKSLNAAVSISIFNSLELTNAALQAEFAGHLEAGLGNLIISRFESEVEAGRLNYAPFNPANAIARATELSRRYTLAQGHRTYDVLLVAASLEMNATEFLTFDERQAKLARAEGLRVTGVKDP